MKRGIGAAAEQVGTILTRLRCVAAWRSARSRAKSVSAIRSSAATPRAPAATQPEGPGSFASWVRRKACPYCRYGLRLSPAHAAKYLRRSGSIWSQLALILLLLMGQVMAAPPILNSPRHIMSLTVCTDELLMDLAPPSRIASISYLSREKAALKLWPEAAHIPVNHNSAEEVLITR